MRPVSALILARIARRSPWPRPCLQVLGDVEVGLVERERLDEWRVLGEDRPDLVRDRPVDVETRLHEDQLRALPPGGDRGHGRADAELAGLVAGGRHDAPLARPADCDRLAAELGIVALLDGRVEGVHVDVDDLPLPPGGTAWSSSSSEVTLSVRAGLP